MARIAVVGAFLAGAILVSVCFVAYGPAASAPALSLAQKKAVLKNIARTHKTMLNEIKFGAQTISDEATAAGNMGAEWNYGQNFGGHASTSPTVHSGGVGMFGSFGTDETYAPTLCAGTAGAVCAG